MPEYLDDPSSLTKDKLKSELLAHNVELPSGNPTKDVYVQLYLRNLTAQKKQHVAAATLDAFSSDEELPPPVVSNRSRSSGRKATRKTDKARPDELDVTLLSDEGLRDELLKYGVDIGPIVASTRKLYEKKLQKLLDDGPAHPPMPQAVVTENQVNHNGNSESDLYSDKEDDVPAAPEPEPVAEPEPAPVVERPVRSRGKTPISARTHSSSSQHNTRDQVMHEDDDDDLVLRVKRRSGRLFHKTIMPEDLRPVLTAQVQSNRRDSPARTETSNWSRPAQEPAAAVGPSSTHMRAAARSAFYKSKSLPEEHRPQLVAKTTRPSSPLVQLTKVDPVTFSPMCDISPIKKQECHWSVSDQCGSAAGEECAPLHKERQQKISSFLSTCSPVTRRSYMHTPSKELTKVEKIAASEQTTKVEEKDVLKELFTNDIHSPTGITATCRRPIRGAAGRPLKSSDLWNDENCYFSPKITKTSSNSSSYTESRTVNRVSSLPLSTSSRLLSAVPPASQTKATRRSVSLWIKLFLLAIVAAFLFLVYQAMETNTINPFAASDTAVSSSSTA